MTDVSDLLVEDLSGTTAEDRWEDLKPPSQERFDRNMAALRRHMARVAKTIEAWSASSTIVETEDGDLNLTFGDVPLYKAGANADSRRLLDTHWRMPSRILLGRTAPSNLDPDASKFLSRVVERCADEGIRFFDFPVEPFSHFLIVFGVGLGAHLVELSETTQAEFTVLVEPTPEFLWQSLWVFDWETYLDHLSSQGRRLIVLIDNDPHRIATTVMSHLRTVNTAGMDGAHVFTLYDNSVFANVHNQLKKDVQLTLMGLGYLEDEICMISNTARNLRTGNARIIKVCGEARRDLPVMIVANGPSLDKHFDHIATNAANAVVIACGSVIEPLLKRGIRPDFHIMMERETNQYTAYKPTADEYGFHGICLIGSTTLYEKVAELYDEHILFFRPGLSSFPAFCRSQENVLQSPDPTVANGALAFAQQTGFREFYLFGVDLGKRADSHHHSELSTITRTAQEETRSYHITNRGNFGGEVTSSTSLNWARQCLEQAVYNFLAGRRYFNCSDGALIKGFIPKRAESLRLAPAPRDKRLAVRELIDSMPLYSVSQYAKAWEQMNFSESMPAFCSRLVAIIESAESLWDSRYLVAMMNELLPKTGVERDMALAMFFRGTVFQMLMGIDTHIHRIIDPLQRQPFEVICREEFRMSVDNFRDQGMTMVTALEEEFDHAKGAGA